MAHLCSSKFRVLLCIMSWSRYKNTNTHILFGLNMNLRCIFGILGMKLERKPMPGGQTQDLSQKFLRHHTGFFPGILPCWKLLRFQDISRWCVSWHWSFPGFPVARCCHAQHQNPSPKNRLLRPSSTRPQVAAQPGTQYSRAKGGFGTTRTGGTKSGKTNAKQDNG